MPTSSSAPVPAGPAGPRILVLGRPGSGKGIQCERLAPRLGVPHVSTGDLFRATAARDTPLGQTLRGCMEAGELVPDDLVVDVVDDRLGPDGATTGFVLDGFPRTVAQAEQLEDLLLPHTIDLAIDLVVSPDVARARLLRRLVCGDCGRTARLHDRVVATRCDECGGALGTRDDDVAATVARRLALHDAQMDPLLEWLAARDVLVRVDGHGTPEQVAARIDAACDRLLCSDLVG